jgi:hypothetical protein
MTDPKTQLTEHFTLAEMTRSSSHPEIYNVPSPAAVENLKRVCMWLEELRFIYNKTYNTKVEWEPIRVTSGYRSEKLNRAVGGAKDSNHLYGCAADIRCQGCEQALRYAAILMNWADEMKYEFDEIIVEKKFNSYWLHFAVRPQDNRRYVSILQKR